MPSGECCLTGACNCQSCMNDKTDEDLQHSLSDNRRRLVQTSDNSTQSAVYLSDHVGVDTTYQLDTDEDCKQAYSACDTEMNAESDQHRITCNVCNRKFAKASKLKIHMCIHTGDRPFSCKDCDKMFTFSSGLIRHKRVHTGE